LSAPSTWLALREIAKARPPTSVRVVVSSTPRIAIPTDPIARHVIVSIEDIFASSADSLAVDAVAFAARLRDGLSHRRATNDLVVEADGKHVWFAGRDYHFAKGHRQSAIVSYIHQRLLEGETIVSVAKLAEDIGLSRRARIRDYFKGAKGARVMSELLFENKGTCGFRPPRKE
jgi:hypothetical protein